MNWHVVLIQDGKILFQHRARHHLIHCNGVNVNGMDCGGLDPCAYFPAILFITSHGLV